MVNAGNFGWHKKKRSYWEQFAKNKVKELLKDEEPLFPEREPMYTAHCGPKSRIARSPSVDSVATDISLLSVSTVSDDKPEMMKRKRKKKVKAKGGKIRDQRTETKQGPGWESFAKEKKGILDAMIKKDTGNLEGFVKGKVIDRARASDMMTEEERTLIMNCGYTTGIACKEKSASTENLFSFYTRGLPENQLNHEPKSGSENETRPASIRTPHRTGRTPSPRFVIQEQTHYARPASAMPFVNLSDSRPGSRMSDGKAESRRRRFSKVSRLTGLKDGQHQASRRGSLFPSIDGRLLGRKANRKIQSTIHALYRMTGYGDPVSVIAPQYEENNFTAQDYGRTVRYPQSIRVAPSLTRVITSDIRGRVGRPRRKQIKSRDVKIWDEECPRLDRSHRNLIIFDWLRNVEEDAYEIRGPPEIEDLEGKRPRTRAFPTLVPGLVGEEPGEYFTFSRERSSLSARFTDSPFYEVSDDDNDGDNTSIDTTDENY